MRAYARVRPSRWVQANPLRPPAQETQSLRTPFGLSHWNPVSEPLARNLHHYQPTHTTERERCPSAGGVSVNVDATEGGSACVFHPL